MDILSESRKYGLNLILAHQYLDQLDEGVRSAIFGNVGTMIAFTSGADDACVLAKEFHPVFDVDDFINLSRYHVYLKMMIDGVTSKPFSATTLSSLKPWGSYKKEVVEFSRIKHGRHRQEVESDT